jgi:hypothetical protein
VELLLEEQDDQTARRSLKIVLFPSIYVKEAAFFRVVKSKKMCKLRVIVSIIAALEMVESFQIRQPAWCNPRGVHFFKGNNAICSARARHAFWGTALTTTSTKKSVVRDTMKGRLTMSSTAVSDGPGIVYGDTGGAMISVEVDPCGHGHVFACLKQNISCMCTSFVIPRNKKNK